MRKVINNRQYAGRRFNKSVSLRSWGPVYDSATQDVTSLLLLLALYYYLSLSLFFLHLFLTSLAIVPYFTTLSLSPPFTLSPPYWFLPFLSSLSLCFHANLLFIKSKELVPPQAYSNLPVWLSVLQQNSCEATTLLDSFHDFLPFFSLKNVPSFSRPVVHSIIYSTMRRDISMEIFVLEIHETGDRCITGWRVASYIIFSR